MIGSKQRERMNYHELILEGLPKSRIFGYLTRSQNIQEQEVWDISKEEEKTMNWTTIYITGQGDFRSELRKRLEHGDQRFMPGYVENSSEMDTHDLYWLDGRTTLQLFKEAIGAKLIWKFRLRFFTTLEDFLTFEDRRKNPNAFTDDELSRIAAMQAMEDKAA